MSFYIVYRTIPETFISKEYLSVNIGELQFDWTANRSHAYMIYSAAVAEYAKEECLKRAPGFDYGVEKIIQQ